MNGAVANSSSEKPEIVATPAEWEPRDYVFTFSFETYADASFRGFMRPPDRIMQTLMAHPSVRRLIVTNPQRWYPRILFGVVLDRHATFPTSDRIHLHKPGRWHRPNPVEMADVKRDMAALDRSLRRVVRRHGLERANVVTAHPFVAGFCEFSWADRVTFFCRDDWLSTIAYRPLWPAFAAAYDRISHSERGVIAVSQEIVDRIAPRGPAMVLPNGIEPGEWLGAQPADPKWLASIPHPRAIYVGTLDQRLDIEGLAELARALPSLQIVLLGPCSDEGYLAAIADVPNVHIHPHVGRAELAATLRNADICLLSHLRSPLTEAMSPLKVYEYLAAGCPVVATDLPPVRSISDRVLLAADVASSADLVKQALDMGRWKEPARRAFIEQNSWRHRHDRLLAFSRGLQLDSRS
jgi:teichuronic acid biosynthesis glycosyltransferase TuaH